jgi:sugar phosphate permease
MMAGGIIVGVVSDLFGGRRACVIGTFMGCLMIFLYVFSKKSKELSAAALLVMLTIMGILVGGPNSIITSAVAANLASHPSIQGINKSLGTMTGLTNGCGSITASVGLLAVGPLQEAFGWSSVWLSLMGSVFTGTALMGGKMYNFFRPHPTVPCSCGISLYICSVSHVRIIVELYRNKSTMFTPFLITVTE